MPIYEYRCQACRHELEAMQTFSDPPLSECPECQGSLEKLISRSAVHFKGSGWYITDYARKEKQAAAPKSADATDTKPAETSEVKAEPKPAESKTAAA